MNKETIVTVETPSESENETPVEQHALETVALRAIDETTNRIEALVQATVELRGAREEIEKLREAFHEAIEGRQQDFIVMGERLATFERGLEVMREAIKEKAEEAVEAEEPEAMMFDEAQPVIVETPIVAPVDHESEHGDKEHHKRHFVRL